MFESTSHWNFLWEKNITQILSYFALANFRLSGCMVTKVGCNALASALTSNPFLSTRGGPELQSSRSLRSESEFARLSDKDCRLHTLRYGEITRAIFMFHNNLNLW